MLNDSFEDFHYHEQSTKRKAAKRKALSRKAARQSKRAWA